jgi:hypothetical protein
MPYIIFVVFYMALWTYVDTCSLYTIRQLTVFVILFYVYEAQGLHFNKWNSVDGFASLAEIMNIFDKNRDTINTILQPPVNTGDETNWGGGRDRARAHTHTHTHTHIYWYVR